MLDRRELLRLSATAVGLGTATVAGCATDVNSTPTAASESASGATMPAPAGVLSANVNQNLDVTNFAELRAVSSTWLRGFYLVHNAGSGPVAAQPGIKKLLSAVDQGYGTVLNLKFDYPQGLPTPGSSAMNRALRYWDDILSVVMGKVDILVVGNEPFYECSQHDRRTATINTVYELLARHTIDYRQQHGGSNSKTQLYLGALTDLEDPASRTPQTDRWLEFAKNTPAIAGTDCHPHVASLSDAQRYPDYILPRLRADQKFLATEFSLVKLYKTHLVDPVAAAFASHYDLPARTPVWQFIRNAIAHPVTQTEWNDFLDSCTWFADNNQFVSELMGSFRATGRCAVAGYGLTQDTAMTSDFGPASTPWVLVSMFCPDTTIPRAGLPGRNLAWTKEFSALQHA